MEKTRLSNAHKVAFLVKRYPDKMLSEIVEQLAMPAIEINTAIWTAVELGLIAEPSQVEDHVGEMKFLKAPKKWQFGAAVDNLLDMLEYSFKELAKTERDLDEVYVSNWTLGYDSHDVIIAVGYLLDTKVLAQYELTDPKDLKSTYTFTTGYDSREQMWGRKYFAEEPTGAEVAEDPNSDNVTEE